MERHISVEPFPPGEFIRDEMEARGWTQDDLASVLRMSRRQVLNLIAGKSGITLDTARALADALGTDPQTWMNLQISYELSVAEKDKRDTARRATIFDKVPVRDLAKRGWIELSDETDQLEHNVCRFLSISRIADEPQRVAAARKSTSYALDTPAQTAWFCRAAQLGRAVHTAKFNPGTFDDGILELLTLVNSAEDVRRVPRVLANMGIRLVLIEHLPRTKIDGAALWIDGSPVIALSLRYDRIDYFWFSLLHEMIHIKYHDEPAVDVDVTGDDSDLPEHERRANREAASYLVPHDKLENFIARTRPLYYKKKVIQFAQARGIHPGIVVGQLQRRKELKYEQLRGLLVKVREFILGSALTDGWGNMPNVEGE